MTLGQDFELLQENGSIHPASEEEDQGEETSWSLCKRLGAGISVGFLLGFETVIFVGLEPLLQSELKISCFSLDNLLTFFPLALLGTPIVLGSLLPKHNFSKLPFYLFCGILFLSSGLSTLHSPSVYNIFFGQLLAGIAISGLCLLHLEYLVNISSAKHRGKTIGSIELGVAFGVTFAHLMDIIFSSTPGGYKYALLFLPVVVSVVLVILLVIQDPLSSSTANFLLTPPKNTDSQPLIIAGGLVVLKQLSGEPNILYYAKEIFERLGFCDGVRASTAALSISSVQIVATGIALSIVDKVGRRLLLILGTLSMALSMAVLSIEELRSGREWEPPVCQNNYTFDYDAVPMTCNEESPKEFEAIVLVSLVFYVFAYSASLGPLAWILISEMGKCTSVPIKVIGYLLSINWASKFLVYETFYESTKLLGLGGVFLSYTFFSFTAFLFVLFLVPETKGRRFQNIAGLFQKRSLRDIITDWQFWKTRGNTHEESASYSVLRDNPNL